MYKIRFYCIDGAHYEYLEQETIDENVTCSTHPESEIRDFVVIEDMNDLTDAIAKKHTQNNDVALRTDKFTVDANGKVHINISQAEALEIGNGAVGIDYKIIFNGDNGNGEIVWQEAKDKFKIDCGLDITGCGFIDNLKEYTSDVGVTIEEILLKDGDLTLGATGAVLTDGVNSATVLEIKNAVSHKDLTNNPHNVTAEQLGYGMTYEEDETVSSTTDDINWQQKLRMNFTPPSTGNYLLEWSIEITNSKVTSSTLVQIELDDTTQINNVSTEPGVVNEYCNHSGFKKINFVDTNLHTIDVDFKAEADTALIRRVRLSIRKI